MGLSKEDIRTLMKRGEGLHNIGKQLVLLMWYNDRIFTIDIYRSRKAYDAGKNSLRTVMVALDVDGKIADIGHAMTDIGEQRFYSKHDNPDT